jgi:hypothetical protein
MTFTYIRVKHFSIPNAFDFPTNETFSTAYIDKEIRQLTFTINQLVSIQFPSVVLTWQMGSMVPGKVLVLVMLATGCQHAVGM